MHEFPSSLFDVQQMLAESAGAEAQKLEPVFRTYNVRDSIAAIGGLLTIPVLQANTVRLEAMAHLAVSYSAGKKRPHKADVARWFKRVGQVCAHMEDPAEDVFVGRVFLDGRNYRVLEGLAEAGCHHLQHILQAVESMPDRGVYSALRQSCHAMLLLSDAICARSGLEAFVLGGESPIDALPIEQLSSVNSLGARVTFSNGELVLAGINRRALGLFCLPPSDRAVGIGGYGDSSLERQPLVDFVDEILVALPSAMGTAIRRAVIEVCQRTGAEFSLWTGLLIAQTQDLSENPAIARANVPPTEMKRESRVVPSEPVEFQPGLWFQLILLTDDFTGFSETGFAKPAPQNEKTQTELQQAIDGAASELKTRPGFKFGVSLVVLCGFGRSQHIGYTNPSQWLVEGISSYDLEVLGWRSSFDVAELLKFLLAEDTAEHLGFPLAAMNGLLARIGFAYENDGHVVPHEAMPDGVERAMVMVPMNAHLRLRAEHHQRFDKHVLIDPSGKALVVRRKDGGKRSPESTQRVYVSYTDALSLRYRGVWLQDNRSFWVETSSPSERSHLYPIFEMQMVWLERLAPVLLRHFPKLPPSLTWHIITPPWPSLRSIDIDPPPREALRAAIKSSHDKNARTITTEIGLPFFHGLSHPNNLSEVTLLEAVIEETAMLMGADVNVSEIVGQIVPSPEARQLHAFAPQNFRDHVYQSLPRQVAVISRFDDAAQRLGLGWHGLPRPGGKVTGRDECTRVLNAITAAAEEMLCEHLQQFERRSVVSRVVENHEASVIDRSRWERTSGAMLDLSANPEAARQEVFDKVLQANATGYASRVILEAAICECPTDTGFEVANFDLSNLMAMAMMIHHLGGYSDAIRYEGMKPEIRISPAGEVQVDVSFFDGIVTPVGESFISGQIDRNRRGYSDLLRDPTPMTEEQAASRIDARFADAWEAEMGISLANFRKALEALENRLLDSGKAWEVLPRQELLSYLSQHVACAEEFVSSIELLPREKWKSIPAGYTDQDRQPWRYRRRLSVTRRPILRLTPSEETVVVIAPGMIRDTFGALIHNFFHGQYDLSSLSSKEMRSWREHIVAEEAAMFEERVSAALRQLGWSAKRGAKFSEVLGRKLPEDPGDIDVLAWHEDGRVVLLECKDLQFAKTSSEIAKQLHKFRGKVDEKGRPDLLGKHLKRIELAQEHAPAFQRHLGLQSTQVSGALIFANTVPMNFAAERIGYAITLLAFDELERAFGDIRSTQR